MAHDYLVHYPPSYTLLGPGDHCPAEFSSNPDQIHLPVSF